MIVDLDGAERRKARGAFFTPPALCDHLVDWAVRSATDRVLEPSCGEAAFLLAAGRRFAALGTTAPALHGHEVHAASAASARSVLAGAGFPGASVHTGDFLALTPDGSFDAVVGNPPYVRYQAFTGEARAAGRRAALRAGVALTKLASSWAAFTVHAALFLRPGGRLGLVLPAELLSVNYAAEVRRFLLERFGRVRLVLFTERVFPGVLEEVVLLLADGVGPAGHCELVQVTDLAELTGSAGASSTWRPADSADKWTAGLMPAASLSTYAALSASEGVGTLQTWGETTLGAVTGNNRWFALSPAAVAGLGLPADDVVPISPPGSRHLRGLALTRAGVQRLGAAGAATALFRPAADPSPAARAYIAAGEAAGVSEAYKCRVRRPWWRVPLVPPADLLLTYMNADTPRLTANQARVHHLNSVHGVYLRPGLRRLGSGLLPVASLNALTLLGAETVGRAYGGGMLKLEPREADRLPMPAPEVVADAADELRGIRPRVAALLAAGQLAPAVRLVDEVILRRRLGLDSEALRSLEHAHAHLSTRRLARSRGRRA